MGQNIDNLDNKKNSNTTKKHTSSTLELARELGIFNSKDNLDTNRDLERLELIIDSSTKEDTKEPLKKSKKCLSKDDLPSLTKALLDDKNRDILQQLLENIEASTLKEKAKNIQKSINNKQEESTLEEVFNSKDTIDKKDSQDSNELLKLVLDSDTKKEDTNIENELLDTTIKEEPISLQEEQIKVDKFYVIDKEDKNFETKDKVTSKDIDNYLSKKVTYEDKESIKSYAKAKKVDTTSYEYKELSAIATLFKAILYPILALLPLVMLAWLKEKLLLNENYLNQVEPYRNDILRFFNTNNIDMKIVTYVLLAITLILALIFTISFIKRIFAHIKNSKMATDKRFNYVPSKTKVFFIYLKSILLVTIAIALFIATFYAILYFTQGAISLSELNIKEDFNSIIEWGRVFVSRYIN